MTCSVDARPARAQAIAIEIENPTAQAETCLTSQQLSARVAHYSSPKTRPSGVQLILYITGPDAADLHILRAGTVVSRRSFTQLPAPCADRRDAVALSIALALERTAADRATASPAAANSGTGEASVASTASSSPTTGGTDPIVDEDEDEDRDKAEDNDKDKDKDDDTEVAVSPEPEPEPEPQTFDNIPTTTSRDPRRKSTNESSLQLHLGGRLTLEAVPPPVWVAALGVELPISSSFTLGITALMSSVGESALAGARARASFLGLEAVGCTNLPLGPFMLQACGGAAVALCEVSGRDYPRARPEATLLWAAVLGRATLRWPRDGFIAARLVLQPHVSINRPDLRIENSSEHLTTFWVGGSAGLELWLALP